MIKTNFSSFNLQENILQNVNLIIMYMQENCICIFVLLQKKMFCVLISFAYYCFNNVLLLS